MSHDTSPHEHGGHPAATPEPTQDGGAERLHWAVWSVFARPAGGAAARTAGDDASAAAEFDGVVEQLAAEGVTLRGAYDVSGMREDADVLTWLHGDDPQALQSAVRRLRRTELLAGTAQAWNAMGVHRDAEFTRNHSPSFARGVAPEDWVCVYPFVRSYEWYYMNAQRRSEMLRNHGMAARDYPQVLANTIACFGLNDFEWLLALEAPELVDLVDVMRAFRNTEARLHVREETPFYTGRRIRSEELAEVLR
ncbi:MULTISPECIES: hydrogen peroxide-dependent heme synthase [Kocuria]|uniref:Coproheme decarboxylase n=1 Tax=Kocuria rosea subsp. polaris TaxID=136273 RepID=A0A0A6VTN8_KOCRO|nr:MULTISPECIES: hydrogen peroxide-dependent heme synthase [Kocuria]KHD97219.1 chlorite dismutase [Kocuria polaris]NVC23559.1 chlorite dismutase [Kocuria salina]